MPTSRKSRWLLPCVLILLGAMHPEAARAQKAAQVAPPAPPASPASFDLDRNRLPETSLDGLWRFHPGDDPHWADPAFDDSSWALLRSDAPWSDQGYPAMSGYAWYRFNVQLSGSEEPLAIGLKPILTGYQVFAEGRLVGGAGSIDPRSFPLTDFNFNTFPLNLPPAEKGPRTVHFAIRVWHSPMWASYEGGGPQYPGHIIGSVQLLTVEQQHNSGQRRLLFIDSYAYTIAASIISLTIFGLFWFRPRETEYLWLALVLLSKALDAAITILNQAYGLMSIPIFDLLDALLIAAAQVALMLFLMRVLRIQRGRFLTILLVMAGLSPLFVPLYWPGWISVPIDALLSVLFLLPSSLWMLAVLVRGSMRRELTARLLLIPVLAVQGLYVADNITVALYQFGVPIDPELLETPFITTPFSVHENVLAELLFLLAMLGFLIRRFTIARRREERLEGALEAARQVQQLLLPEAIPQIPGFTVDCVYRPAESVGGDFFQVIPAEDGGLLIIFGDVAGKGLPAAMMVSMIVGAARTEAAHTSDPSELLSMLNERMVGRSQGSSTTCLCTHISVAGQLRIAGAGHLPPYINGKELELAGSLPLGIISGALYETTSLTLASGDHLTFVSDGVVEAQDKSGKLFGFERTADLSSQSASNIADAASLFGQEDDITVVTLDFFNAQLSMAAD